MRRPALSIIRLVIAFATALSPHIRAIAQSTSADAAATAFRDTWKRATDQPESAASTWKDFAQAQAKHDLAQLARLMQAIAMLRDEKRDVSAIVALCKVDAGGDASPFRK